MMSLFRMLERAVMDGEVECPNCGYMPLEPDYPRCPECGETNPLMDAGMI